MEITRILKYRGATPTAKIMRAAYSWLIGYTHHVGLIQTFHRTCQSGATWSFCECIDCIDFEPKVLKFWARTLKP